MKRLISMCLLMVFVFNGCVTKTLWGDRETKLEQVQIKEFLYSKEKKLIVFLAENYHFIFDDDLIGNEKYDLMMSMLSLKKDERVGISIDEELTSIHVVNTDDIFCHISLNIDIEILDKDQIEFYKRLDFIDYYNKDKKTMRMDFKLSGKIYKVKESFKNYTSNLNKSYKINLHMKVDNDTELERYGKLALTPLTLVADTALTAAGIGAGIGITALGISTVNPKGLEAGFTVMFRTVELQASGFMEFMDRVEKVNIK